MKRKNEKVPEFDEIIFADRNKTYGAYSLRKQYNSITSISILGSVSAAAILLISLSFTAKREIVIPVTDKGVFITTDPIIPKVSPPEQPKIPSKLNNAFKNLKPVVVSDTQKITNQMASIDDINKNAVNGTVTDIPDDTLKSDPYIPPEEKDKVFITVEENPEFPGGEQALLNFIGANLKYPEEAQRNNIQGKVILKFVVNPDGSVDRIEVLRGIDPILDNEAIRVVKILPKFKPGKQSGVPVKVWFMLPVSFRMQN